MVDNIYICIYKLGLNYLYMLDFYNLWDALVYIICVNDWILLCY